MFSPSDVTAFHRIVIIIELLKSQVEGIRTLDVVNHILLAQSRMPLAAYSTLFCRLIADLRKLEKYCPLTPPPPLPDMLPTFLRLLAECFLARNLQESEIFSDIKLNSSFT